MGSAVRSTIAAAVVIQPRLVVHATLASSRGSGSARFGMRMPLSSARCLFVHLSADDGLTWASAADRARMSRCYERAHFSASAAAPGLRD